MVNKIKLLVAFLLLAAGIAGFYLLADKATVLRILAVVAGLGAAVAVLWTTPVGQQSLGFIGESVAEARKVVWPTRKETVQTTLVVFVLVVIMAAFLALVDIGFAYMVQWLMGRNA
jgi:preprotein translocase subunit SecE